MPGGHRFDKKLLCVRYPGVVENTDRAIETLGGLGAMSMAVNTPNRRLELRFRPDDGYCKPTCGDRGNTAGFLLRVRVKKSRAQQMEEAKVAENNEYEGPFDLAKLNELLGNLGKGVLDTASSDNANVDGKKSNADAGETSKRAVDDSMNNQELLIAEREISFSNKSDRGKNADENRKGGESLEGTKIFDDLSKDENYEIPKVKVLGRVETEFTFQSNYYLFS